MVLIFKLDNRSFQNSSFHSLLREVGARQAGQGGVPGLDALITQLDTVIRDEGGARHGAHPESPALLRFTHLDDTTRRIPGTIEGGYETAWAGATPWATQSCQILIGDRAPVGAALPPPRARGLAIVGR